MEQIKKYFSKWDIARIIRLLLALAFGAGYFFTKETIYLFASTILGLQAILNISCPGGSCSTGVSKESKPIIKTEKYEPNNQ